MKQFSLMLVAGMIGALLTIVIVRQTPLVSISEPSPAFVKSTSTSQTLYTPPSVSTSGAIDLTVPAEMAMQVVVQIKAKESSASAQHRREEQQRSDPWSRFFNFGDDLFGSPFGLRPREGAGSGVIVSADGYIVTNNHVVDFADEVIVKTQDKEYVASIVGRDPSTDLAVLKINAKNLPVLRNGNSDEVKVGEWVLAVGNPFEYLTSTVTAGIVSAKGRDLNIIRGERTIEAFIQTDAAINPGNSGGALVDADGNLIGINAAIASPTGSYSGYSFAIPINLVSRIIDDLVSNGGVIERTNLGVIVEELDREYAKELGISIDQGLMVRELLNGGAAQFAGILPNDVIVKVDGRAVTKFQEIQDIMNFAKVGDTLSVTVFRKGEYLDIPVRLRKKI
jgi:S1-C subfamily serine protease